MSGTPSLSGLPLAACANRSQETALMTIRRTEFPPGAILGLAGSHGPYYEVVVKARNGLFPSYEVAHSFPLSPYGGSAEVAADFANQWKHDGRWTTYHHRYGHGYDSEDFDIEWDRVERNVQAAVGGGVGGVWLQLQHEHAGECDRQQAQMGRMCVTNRAYVIHYNAPRRS